MTDDATRDHNVKARKDQLLKAFQEYEGLYYERKLIGKEMTAIVKVIKDDLTISPAAFKNAFKLWQMEPDDRDVMLDAMHECFDALGIGGQMDFLTALARQKDRETAAA